jgi:membrane peptidoglycan carboxypeptidase
MPGSAPRRLGTAASAFLGMIAVAVIAGVMVAVAVTPAIALTGTSAKNGIGLFENLPADLKIAPLDQKTEIYAKDGTKNVLLASFYTQNRQVIPWKDVSAVVKNAAVAGEDVRFYEHGGVDPLGIVRATVANAMGKNLQGASTITQQYVKNVCVQEAENLRTQKAIDAAYAVCTDTSVTRKLKEARLAISLEKQYSKDQILLGYLNIAGFGGRVYGIESAAEYYFDTTAAKLTVAQAASLMAIVNNPENLRLDEKANYAANEKRRNYILGTELQHKMISKAQYTAAVATKIAPKITETRTGCTAAGVAGYFCDYVVNTILSDKHFGATYDDRYANLESAGWKIYTTLDLSIEKKAQKVMNTYVPKKSDVFKVAGAAVSVEVGTGRIISMVQNKNYDNSKGAKNTVVNYNANETLGASGGFQPGSTFKLFTLLQWLKTGHTLNEEVNANPGTFAASSFTACGKTYDGQDWNVSNDEASEGGYHTVSSATALSINGAFATMAQQVDLCDVQKLAESFGVYPANGDKNPSLYLPFVIGGSYGVAPVAMATAYAGIANNGKSCSPIAIDHVVKSDGSDLAVPGSTCKQVVDPQVAIAAASALRGVFTGGTASGDNTPDGIYEFGKTGTTDNNENTWMIGTTSKVTTAVLVGNNGSSQDLRQTSFDYCPAGYSSLVSVQRHCVWKGIQTAINAKYGGATTWAQPESQYLYGGTSSTTTQTTTGSVPDVSGMTKSAAAAALVAAGYSWAYGSDVASSKPAGQVASTTPAAGSTAAAHSQVVIHASSG